MYGTRRIVALKREVVIIDSIHLRPVDVYRYLSLRGRHSLKYKKSWLEKTSPRSLDKRYLYSGSDQSGVSLFELF